MPDKYFVIDFGGTSTKALYYEDHEVVNRFNFESEQYECSKHGIRQILDDVKISHDVLSNIIITGGKSMLLQNSVDGTNILRVNEIEAIGAGGLLAAQKSKALVVSMGTGTAIVVAKMDSRKLNKYHAQHVGGLALGGGTILGLGKLLCQVQSFEELDALAVAGKSDNVDLLVEDIVGSGIGIIPGNLTASNFGRVANKKGSYAPSDIAAGLFTMVGQSISRLAIVLAKQHRLDVIVVIGQVSENAYMRQVFQSMQQIFGGQFIFVPEARYKVAEGAFILAGERSLNLAGL